MTDNHHATNWPEAHRRLAAPFPELEVQWRTARSGFTKAGKPWAQVLAYLDARQIDQRLDDVFGNHNWKEEFRSLPGGYICRLWYRLDGSDEWLWKEDGANETDVEAFKGGLSDARKRAAVHLGIGAYLYELGDSWAVFLPDGTKGRYTDQVKDEAGMKHRLSWNPPRLPGWAVPTTPPSRDEMERMPPQLRPEPLRTAP